MVYHESEFHVNVLIKRVVDYVTASSLIELRQEEEVIYLNHGCMPCQFY